MTGVGAAGVAGAAGALVAAFVTAVVAGGDDAVVLEDALIGAVTDIAPSAALLPFAAEVDEAVFAAAVAAADDAAAVVAPFADFGALSPLAANWTTAADALVAGVLLGAADESAAASADALTESGAATAPLPLRVLSFDVAAAGLTPFSSVGGRRRPSSSDANRSAASRVRRLPAE